MLIFTWDFELEIYFTVWRNFRENKLSLFVKLGDGLLSKKPRTKKIVLNRTLCLMNCLFCMCSGIKIVYTIYIQWYFIFFKYKFDYRYTTIVWIWSWRLWGFRNGCEWMWDLMLVLIGFEEWMCKWGRYRMTGIMYRLTTDFITKYCIFIKNIPHFF